MKKDIIQKESFYATIVNFAGVGVAYLNLIFVLPHFLNLEEIGLLRLIIEMATLFSLIFQLGAAQVVIRFFPKFQNNDLKMRSFLSFTLILGITGVMILILAYSIFRAEVIGYFSEKSGLVVDFERNILIIAASIIVYNILDKIFGTRKNILIPTILREGITRIGLSVVAISIGLHYLTLANGIGLWVIIYLIGPLVLLYLYKIRFGLKFAFDSSVWNTQQIRTFLGFAGVVSIGTIGSGISLRIDMLMTGSLIGLSELGIYATMVYMATVIEIPRRALAQISTPFISEYINENKYDKIEVLYRKNSLVLLVLGIFIFMAIFFNLPYLFEIMPKGEAFSIGLNVFLIIGCMKLLLLLSGLADQIVVYSKYAWVGSLSVLVLSVISIGLNLLLIPEYGINGAALATLISVGIHNVFLILFVRIKFGVHPFSKPLITLLIATSLVFALFQFIPHFSNPFMGILSISFILTTVYSLLIWKLNISPDVNIMVINGIQKFRKVLKL
ncbi:MAG: polysaccharide biosynthesis C-terminal domain-containing protein [Salibacteraceae bacterium]